VPLEFRGSQLAPGGWLEWRDGEVSTGSYWALPFGVSNAYTIESAKEELDVLTFRGSPARVFTPRVTCQDSQ